MKKLILKIFYFLVFGILIYGNGYLTSTMNKKGVEKVKCENVKEIKVKDVTEFFKGNPEMISHILTSSNSSTWAMAYGGSGKDISCSIIHALDGGYVVAGDTTSFVKDEENFSDFLVIKLDSKGNVIWAKTYDDECYDISTSIINSSDGNYILMGYSGSLSLNDTREKVFLMKLNGDGDVLWAKSYECEDSCFSKSILKTSNGDFLLAVDVENFDTTESDFMIVKLNSNGRLLWANRYSKEGDESVCSVVKGSDDSFVVLGNMEFRDDQKYKQNIFIIKISEDGNTIWAKSYNIKDSNSEVANYILQDLNGNYIIVGNTVNLLKNSSFDILLLKINPDGEPLWANVYGSEDCDLAFSSAETPAGELILVGDVENYQMGLSKKKFLTMKFDSEGKVIFAKVYGKNIGFNVAHSVISTENGGFVAAGNTSEFGVGDSDFLVMKSDPNGDIFNSKYFSQFDYSESSVTENIIVQDVSNIFSKVNVQFSTEDITDNIITDGNLPLIKSELCLSSNWKRIYGGNNRDEAISISQIVDNGFIVGGNTTSFGSGGKDFLILKLNNKGNVEWAKTYGGDEDEILSSLIQTSDGGYIAAGETTSFGAGSGDFFVVRLNGDGDVIWAKTYGGAGNDFAYSIIHTQNDGYAIAGESQSFGDGDFDILVINLDSTGNINWANTYGGNSDEREGFLTQDLTGDYIIAGSTQSFNRGDYDFFILCLSSDGSLKYFKTFGGSGDEFVKGVMKTLDHGFIMLGNTTSLGAKNKDFMVLKLNFYGDVSWAKIYGGENMDIATSIIQIPNDFYLIGGYTISSDGISSPFAVKLNFDGSVKWSKIYEGNRDEGFYSLIYSYDGEYVFSGFSNEDALVVKIDSKDGVSTCFDCLDYSPEVKNIDLSEESQDIRVNSPNINVGDELSSTNVQLIDQPVELDTCSPNADLAVSIIDPPQNVEIGEDITYKIVVVNNGPEIAKNVVIDDYLSPKIEESEFSIDGGDTWDVWDGRLNIGDLSQQETFEILIKIRLKSNIIGEISNTVSVLDDVYDPNLSNNFCTISTTVENSEGNIDINRDELIGDVDIFF